MASPERELISAIVNYASLDVVMQAKVNQLWFNDEEHERVWTWVVSHWTKYGKAPDRSSLRANFPTWKVTDTPEPLTYYVDELRHTRRFGIASDAVLQAAQALKDEDTDEALRALSGAVQEALGTASAMQTEVLTATSDDRIARYEDWAKNPGRLRGWATGFKAIDKATRGIQPEQYIVVAGFQKSGKSTVLMQIAINLNVEADASVLFVSFEMSAEEQAARHDSLRAGVSHNRLLNGTINDKDRKRLDNMADDMEDCKDFVLATDISAMTTISGVRAQLELVKPDVLIIDGVYLMEDELGEPPGTPRALTNISRSIKRLAQSTRVPIVVSTQALEHKSSRKNGVTSHSVGYTTAYGQDCDVMLGIDTDPELDFSILKVVLSRSGPLARSAFQIDWDNGKITELESPPEAGDDSEAPPY